MDTIVASTRTHRGPILLFLRHLGAMTLAMFVGMFAFGLALGLIAGAAGSSLESIRSGQPELFMLGMASAMSGTMVAWMRQRRHTRRESTEMTVAMIAPVVGVLVCFWLGAVAADNVCPLSCVLMIPAMAAAMLFRLDVYTAHGRHAAA